MAQCKWCERKGFFLRVSNIGLCEKCQQVIEMDVHQRGRVMEDSIKLIEDSKKIDTRLSRCKLLMEHLTALYEYERKGIRTISPTPSELMRSYEEVPNNIVIEYLEEEVDKSIAKAELATSAKTAINQANKALLKIRDYKDIATNDSEIARLEKKISRFTHKVEFKSYIDTAKKAEFKGNMKKAIDQYQEALYLLLNDEIDDSLQEKNIKILKAKIAKLQKDLDNKKKKK